MRALLSKEEQQAKKTFYLT